MGKAWSRALPAAKMRAFVPAGRTSLRGKPLMESGLPRFTTKGGATTWPKSNGNLPTGQSFDQFAMLRIARG